LREHVEDGLMDGAHADALQGSGEAHSLVMPLVSGAVIAGSAVGLRGLSVPDQVIVPAAMAMAAIVPAIAARAADRKKGKRERIREIIYGDFERPPVQMLIVCAALVATASVAIVYAFYYLTFVIWDVLSEEGPFLSGEPEIELVLESVVGLLILLSVLVGVPLMVYIARYTTHRIGSHGFVLIFAAIVTAQVIEFLIVSLLAWDPSINWDLVLYHVGKVVLFTPPAWLGYRWAKRTHCAFLARRLSHRVGRDDMEVILSLMRDAHIEDRISADVAP
jgi:hypothetical protein